MTTRKQKGITLVEVVCVVVILGIMGGTIVRLLHTGVLAKIFTEKEYELQATVRDAADLVQNKVRYSTALFILPESSFNYDNVVNHKNTYLTEDWNYIGLIKDEQSGLTRIVEYLYDGKTHREKILMESGDDLNFDMFFANDESISPKNEDLAVIEYEIAGYRPERPEEPYLVVKSEAEALNALQVVDWSTAYDKGVALAYRADERDRPVIGRVVMILDRSGSMSNDMAGNSGTGVADEDKRINILKRTAKELLSNLATEENIEVAVIPFSNFAHNGNIPAQSKPYEFRSLAENYEDIIFEIESISPGGGTNTGDGMRRAHYLMQNTPSPQGAQVREYVIILADGDTNHATLLQDVWNEQNYLDPTGTFLTEDGDAEYWGTHPRFTHTRSSTKIGDMYVYNITGLYKSTSNPDPTLESTGQFVIGGGSILNVIYPEAYQYVELMGEMIAAPELEREFFVIGFSKTISEYCLQHLAESVGIKAEIDENGYRRKFQANSEEDLSDAFNTIKEAIAHDLWYIRGPRTAPKKN